MRLRGGFVHCQGWFCPDSRDRFPTSSCSHSPTLILCVCVLLTASEISVTSHRHEHSSSSRQQIGQIRKWHDHTGEPVICVSSVSHTSSVPELPCKADLRTVPSSLCSFLFHLHPIHFQTQGSALTSVPNITRCPVSWPEPSPADVKPDLFLYLLFLLVVAAYLLPVLISLP